MSILVSAEDSAEVANEKNNPSWKLHHLRLP